MQRFISHFGGVESADEVMRREANTPKTEELVPRQEYSNLRLLMCEPESARHDTIR